MTIIPNLCAELDQYIISFLDTQSQVTLSGVNKTAYEILSNDEHFQKLFKTNCPYLIPQLIKEFPQLTAFYPENCWKIACCIFDRLNFPFSKFFFDQPRPKVLHQLEQQKADLENEQQKICGNFYQDPASPIHQAYQEYEKCLVELKTLKKELETFSPLFEEIIHGRENEFEQLQGRYDRLSGTNLYSFKDFAADRLAFDPRFAPINELGFQIRSKEAEAKLHLKAYQELELKRVEICEQIAPIDQKLTSIRLNPEDFIGEVEKKLADFRSDLRTKKTEHISTIYPELLQSMLSQHEITEKDVKDFFYSVNQMLFSIDVDPNHPEYITYLFSIMVKVSRAMNDALSAPNVNQETTENKFGTVMQTMGECFFNTTIEGFASQPIELITEERREAKQNQLVRLFQLIDPKIIEEMLVDAIRKHHPETLS